jgi:hypothetical protein
MDHKTFTGKMVKSLAEFKICHVSIFIEPGDYDIPLHKILYFVRCMGLLAE